MIATLSVGDYVALQDCNSESGDILCELLNRNGAANWTVCPKCHVDDFTHVEGCELIPKDE